jgi:plasmid stabilization system protein ParE
MKIEWLYEAQVEYRELLSYYKNTVGTDGARAFSKRILETVQKLETFPEMGLIKEELLTGKLGFSSLFIGKYVCIYRIETDTVFIYHLADARTNYIYRIFGMEP